MTKLKNNSIYGLFRVLAAVLLMTVCLAGTASAQELKTFRDVARTDWFYQSVTEANALGLMVGVSEDSFNPAGKITFSEAVTLLARMYAKSIGQTEKMEQAASGAAPWYEGYIRYCADSGLFTEKDADTFRARYADQTTRAELLDVFSRLPDTLWTEINRVSDGAIPDVPMTAPNAAAVYRAYRCGIVIGIDGEGTFCPGNLITRSEVAALVVRIMEPAMRQRITLTSDTVLYAADGSSVTTAPEDRADYLARGWKETPYAKNASWEEILNEMPLDPAKTGYTPLDTMVDGIFARIIKDSMSTWEKVKACYDYLISACSYGSSPASGKYRPIYKSNPYYDPAPDRKTATEKAMGDDRGYYYFDVALKEHALEGYTAMYASEMLKGKVGWCDHYSSAFAVMMRRIGLPCFPLYTNSKNGSVFEPHMTTVMTVGGVDCIFDPQIEDVLVGVYGENRYKRFCRPITEMSGEYRDFGNLEDCRRLFGPLAYSETAMNKVLG